MADAIRERTDEGPADITPVMADINALLQDIESDTGYDTRRRVPEGVISRLSQTSVYDTC